MGCSRNNLNNDGMISNTQQGWIDKKRGEFATTQSRKYTLLLEVTRNGIKQPDEYSNRSKRDIRLI